MPLLDPKSAVAAIMLAAVCAATPLAAQDVPSDEDILVQGVRNKGEAINNYVDGLTVASPNQPLARYAPGEYCPAVLGLSPARNAEIAARMRTVAAAAGVDPAGADCAPSALVFFVNDKETFLREFRTRHPIYFTDLQSRPGGLLQSQGSAAAWQLVQLVDPQGMPVRRAVGGGYSVVESPVGGSRINSMVSSVVAMSVVVIERNALVGLDVTQIADYALMRSLTDREPRGAEMPSNLSILGALDAKKESMVPASLTEWDLAYIKARYTGPATRYAKSQSAAIRNAMRRALTPDDRD